MVTFQTDLDAVSASDLEGFFDGWLNPPSPETLLRLFEGTDHFVLARESDGKRVLGFVTALTDGLLSAYNSRGTRLSVPMVSERIGCVGAAEASHAHGVARSIAIVEQSGLTVRAAEPDDVGAIAGLYLEVAAEVVAREPSFRHVPDAGEVERRYLSRIAEVDRAVLVAVSGNTVVGFVDASLQRHEGGGTYHRTGIDVYVEELIVTASQRRRGVGTALMRAIEAWGGSAEARMILARHPSHKRRRSRAVWSHGLPGGRRGTREGALTGRPCLRSRFRHEAILGSGHEADRQDGESATARDACRSW